MSLYTLHQANILPNIIYDRFVSLHMLVCCASLASFRVNCAIRRWRPKCRAAASKRAITTNCICGATGQQPNGNAPSRVQARPACATEVKLPIWMRYSNADDLAQFGSVLGEKHEKGTQWLYRARGCGSGQGRHRVPLTARVLLLPLAGTLYLQWRQF